MILKNSRMTSRYIFRKDINQFYQAIANCNPYEAAQYNWQYAKCQRFLQQTYPNLLWGSPNARKNTKLMDSCIHGQFKGIADD